MTSSVHHGCRNHTLTQDVASKHTYTCNNKIKKKIKHKSVSAYKIRNEEEETRDEIFNQKLSPDMNHFAYTAKYLICTLLQKIKRKTKDLGLDFVLVGQCV